MVRVGGRRGEVPCRWCSDLRGEVQVSGRTGFRAALNDAAFEEPHWRLVAQGFAWDQLDAYFSRCGGVVERNGGLDNPGRTRLHNRVLYYRFIDMNAAEDDQAGGAWWIDYEQLKKIVDARESRGLNLSQMARTFLAVPWEWNHADGIVVAEFLGWVDAYEGRGRPVRRGKAYTGTSPVDNGDYPGNPNVIQLYIPDMRRIWRQCLRQPKAYRTNQFLHLHRRAPGF